jgi:hypothetical protein
MLATVALLGLGLLGCDSGSGINGSREPDNSTLLSDSFAVVGAEDVYANVRDATFEQEMAMNPVMAAHGFTRHHRHSGHAGSHLAPILMGLDLDQDQLMEIIGALMSHRGAIRDALEGLREVNSEIIDQANAERRAIIESYDAGDISREQAARQLQDLSERTREAIRSNPANEPYLRALCDARRDLFDGIRAILTDMQREPWDSWVTTLPGVCIGG